MNMNELMGELVADHKADIIEAAAEKLAERLAEICLPDAKKLFLEKVNEAAKKRAEVVLEAVDGTVFYETDSYGCKKSNSPITVMDIIRREARGWLQASVNYQGNPSSDRGKQSRGQFLASIAAEELIKGELAPAIEKAKEDLKAEVESTLSRTFIKTLRDCKAGS